MTEKSVKNLKKSFPSCSSGHLVTRKRRPSPMASCHLQPRCPCWNMAIINPLNSTRKHEQHSDKPAWSAVGGFGAHMRQTRWSSGNQVSEEGTNLIAAHIGFNGMNNTKSWWPCYPDRCGYATRHFCDRISPLWRHYYLHRAEHRELRRWTVVEMMKER